MFDNDYDFDEDDEETQDVYHFVFIKATESAVTNQTTNQWLALLKEHLCLQLVNANSIIIQQTIE